MIGKILVAWIALSFALGPLAGRAIRKMGE